MPVHTENPQLRRIAAYWRHNGSTSGTSSMAIHSGWPCCVQGVEVAHGLGGQQGALVLAGGEELVRGCRGRRRGRRRPGGRRGWSSSPRRLPAIDHAWQGGLAMSPVVFPRKGPTGYMATSVRMVNCPAAARVLQAHSSHSRPMSRTPRTVRAWLQPPGPANRSSTITWPARSRPASAASASPRQAQGEQPSMTPSSSAAASSSSPSSCCMAAHSAAVT